MKRTIMTGLVALATAFSGILAPLPAAVGSPSASHSAALFAASDSEPTGTGSLRGKVFDHAWNPLAGRDVYILGRGLDATWTWGATSAADGSWQIDGLDEGGYSVFARAPHDPVPVAPDSIESMDGSSAETRSVWANQVTEVNVKIHEWTRLVGRVSLPAGFHDDVTIRVLRPAGNRGPALAEVADDGSWKFPRFLDEGERTLSILVTKTTRDGQRNVWQEFPKVFLTPGTTQRVDTVLSVLEFDVSSPVSAPDWYTGLVEWWNPKTRVWEWSSGISADQIGSPQQVVVNRAGRYRLRLLSENINNGGLFHQPVEVTLAPGTLARVPDFSYGAARGTLSFPVKAGRISSVNLQQWNPTSRKWVGVDEFGVDAGGRFDAGGLPPGRYRVEARVPATLRKEFTVAPRRTTVVAWTEQLRTVRLGAKGLRIRRSTRLRTGDQVQSVMKFPTGSGVAGVGVTTQWWSQKKVTRGPRKGKWGKPVKIKGATHASFVPSRKYRGRKLQVRIVADSPMHHRTTFRSAWTKRLR